jgi:NitT/TauT family transport system substrate-binding protein
MILMARDDIGKRLGLDVEWRLFGTGPAIVKAFERNELDLAYIGLPPALIGIDRGVGIKCVAGGHIEGTVMSGKRTYKGFPETDDLGDILKQFCGLTIGVPGKGSIHDVIINEYLERFDVKEKIEVINFQWADQVLEAIVRDDVAAAIGTPALAAAVKRYANGRVLYPPSKIWPNNPSYGILVDVRFLHRYSDIVEGFLLLHEEATAFLRSNPHEVAGIISSFIGFIDEDFVMDTLKISPKYCAQITEGYIFSTMEFVKVMKRLGYIGREIAPEDIFDVSLINKIHPSKDHYEAGLLL